jgi:hypothetical protein
MLHVQSSATHLMVSSPALARPHVSRIASSGARNMMSSPAVSRPCGREYYLINMKIVFVRLRRAMYLQALGGQVGQVPVVGALGVQPEYRPGHHLLHWQRLL